MNNSHQVSDLKQMQSLPLEAKILMTKQRIKVWYESWVRFEIHDKATGKVRFVTYDIRKGEPPLKDTEYIETAFDGQVYVSFSGGKDSTVLKHIVDSMYDDVPSLFVNTGLEYPEIQKFAMSQKNVVTVRPEMRFDEVIKKYGYPVVSKEVSKRVTEYHNAKLKGTLEKSCAYQEFNGLMKRRDGKSMFNKEKWRFLLDADFKCSHKCCDVMKKKPSEFYSRQTGRKGIVGTLASDSLTRKNAWIKTGCNAFDAEKPQSQPLSFWTEQDILEYIVKFNLPYASVYGEIESKNGNYYTTGCDRTGCIFCMFGCHLEKEPNRFQRLKETHPRQYQYCIGGGEYVTEWYELTGDGKKVKIDGEPLNDKAYIFQRKWQPSKEGLGLGKVLDYIGVKYE